MKFEEIKKFLVSTENYSNSYASNVPFRDGIGERSFFCFNTWIGESSLTDQFPELFRCEIDKKAIVKDYMDRGGGQVVWCPVLRNLSEQESSKLASLLDLLAHV